MRQMPYFLFWEFLIPNFASPAETTVRVSVQHKKMNETLGVKLKIYSKHLSKDLHLLVANPFEISDFKNYIFEISNTKYVIFKLNPNSPVCPSHFHNADVIILKQYLILQWKS